MKPIILTFAMAALAGTAMAQTTATTWYYGSNDNSTAAIAAVGGATPTSDVSLGSGFAASWGNQFNPNAPSPAFPNYQINPNNLLGTGQAMTFFTLSGTGQSAATVTNATLYVNIAEQSPVNTTVTWEIAGLNPADSNWANTSTGADWTYKNSGASISWTGGNGTLGGSVAALGDNFGTFSYTTSSSTAPNTWLAINVTSAYDAFLNGQIGGIVLEAVPGSTSGTFTGSDTSLVFHSDGDPNNPTDTPGLLVTTVTPVPEPSGALLIAGAGIMMIFRRRRFRH